MISMHVDVNISAHLSILQWVLTDTIGSVLISVLNNKLKVLIYQYLLLKFRYICGS